MAKLDPRVDPVSSPPDAREDFSVDRVAVPESSRGAVRLPEPASDDDATPALESSVMPVDKVSKTITSQDPRYEPVEKLLDVNDWKAIASELGPLAEVGQLPPNLGLVAALAHNEKAKGGDVEATAVAIRCMAGLLGISEESPIARVLARRMLRKNPVRLRERPAPRGRTSVLIVLLTLVLGGGVGWVASIGSWRGVAHALHLM